MWGFQPNRRGRQAIGSFPIRPSGGSASCKRGLLPISTTRASSELLRCDGVNHARAHFGRTARSFAIYLASARLRRGRDSPDSFTYPKYAMSFPDGISQTLSLPAHCAPRAAKPPTSDDRSSARGVQPFRATVGDYPCEVQTVASARSVLRGRRRPNQRIGPFITACDSDRRRAQCRDRP